PISLMSTALFYSLSLHDALPILLGRTYHVACDDDEREALMQAVAYLDAKMNEIHKAGKVLGAERIAVMAALNVAHELLSVKLGRSEEHTSELQSRVDLVCRLLLE